MRRPRIYFLLACICLFLALTGESVRAAPQAGVTVTVSNPTCVQSTPPSGMCYINLRTFNATGTDPTFNRIEITINSKTRAVMSAFFETNAFLNNRMLGPGLLVPCGGPNASGQPNFGKIYAVGLNAYLGGSLYIADSANVTCPYFQQRLFFPAVRK